MPVATAPSGGLLDGVRSSFRETGSSLASVFRNPRLRRMELAFAGSLIGDWAGNVGLAVFAYQIGGARAVGLFYTGRMLIRAATTPFLASLADRYSRRGVMVISDAVCMLAYGASAAVLVMHEPAWLVFTLICLAYLVIGAFRPAQAALMPTLANDPDELIAANATASTLESLAFFIGPVIGSLVLVVADLATVFAVDALSFLWSAALVLSIRTAQRPPTVAPQTEGVSADKPGFLGEVTQGFRALAQDRDGTMVAALMIGQSVVAGASSVFFVVWAVQVLETGPKGVGYIESAFGVGAIIGGALALGRARRRKLGSDLCVGVVLWSLPLVAVALLPTAAVALVAAAAMGLGNPLADVNFATILQRIMPDHVLGRVFGALEGALIAAMAVGAAAMPFLIAGIGLKASLASLGVAVMLLVLPWTRRARRLDRTMAVPPTVPLVESIPMFTPLGPATIESLARKLQYFQVPAGVTIVQEGQESDRFYVIESGSVRVSHGDQVIRHEGAGDFFGEIGLLRDVPRTATVTAEEDTVLQVLERDDFLAAVTGQDDARTAADSIVSRRIAI
ncbi:MAG TPA: MFS transporter [Marmoricola sp.]|nr:MFS transporter [Marmoricola sp.]